jgi:phosphoenolpyruvate phosphomutase
MLPVAGRPLLRHLVDAFKSEGVHEIDVVVGYKAEAVDPAGVRVIENAAHATSGELRSLACAEDSLASDSVVLYGDLLFRPYVLRDLLHADDADAVVVVDSAPLPQHGGNVNDLAYCSVPDDRALYRTDVALERVSRERRWQGRAPDGRWIGMVRFRGRGCEAVREALAELARKSDFDALGMPDLLNTLVERQLRVRVLYIHGHWLDVNDLADLERANAFAGASRSEGAPR